MNRAKIREIMLANGFTIKEGLDDLKPYVYEAVEAVLAEHSKEVMKVVDHLAIAVKASIDVSINLSNIVLSVEDALGIPREDNSPPTA